MREGEQREFNSQQVLFPPSLESALQDIRKETFPTVEARRAGSEMMSLSHSWPITQLQRRWLCWRASETKTLRPKQYQEVTLIQLPAGDAAPTRRKWLNYNRHTAQSRAQRWNTGPGIHRNNTERNLQKLLQGFPIALHEQSEKHLWQTLMCFPGTVQSHSRKYTLTLHSKHITSKWLLENPLLYLYIRHISHCRSAHWQCHLSFESHSYFCCQHNKKVDMFQSV